MNSIVVAVEEIGADFELISKLESKTELILYRKSRCAVETKLDSQIENDLIPHLDVTLMVHVRKYQGAP